MPEWGLASLSVIPHDFCQTQCILHIGSRRHCHHAILVCFFASRAEVRDSANRVLCQNNLKQMGLALTGYHDVYNSFPPAIAESGQNRLPMQWWPGWHNAPFVEQDNLAKTMDAAFAANTCPIIPRSAATAFGTPLPLYHARRTAEDIKRA